MMISYGWFINTIRICGGILIANGTWTDGLLCHRRYAINDAAADWSAAEAQATKLMRGKAGATVVSIRSGAISGQKRKTATGGEEGGGKKPTRRGKKVKR